MTDLARLRSDLAAFAAAVGQPLTSWQAAALALEKRTTTVIAPRQSGKSRSLSVLALWWAFRRPDQRVLVVSAGESASRRLLAEAVSVAQRSPLLSASVVDENSGLLVLTNGSTILSVPASERAIRGWSVDLLLVDEAAQVEDELLLGAAIPTTAARPDARIVLAGSPGAPEGSLYVFTEQAESGSEHVRAFRWQLSDATWIEDAVVAAARESLAPEQFRREYEGMFTDSGDETVIPREHVAAAQSRTLEPGKPIYACDVARHGGDETVIVRLAGGVARVVWSARGLDSVMPIAQKIAQLSNDEAARAAPPPFIIDAPGMGWGVIDRCNELGVPVTAFVGSRRAGDPSRHLNLRSEAYWAARRAFQEGTVDLDPDDRVLAAQLGSVRYGLAVSGAIQIADKSAMKSSPDRCDALVLALYARSQGDHAGLGARIMQDIRREADARRRPTEDDFGRNHVPTELAWSTGPKHERIIPDEDYFASEGARFEP